MRSIFFIKAPFCYLIKLIKIPDYLFCTFLSVMEYCKILRKTFYVFFYYKRIHFIWCFFATFVGCWMMFEIKWLNFYLRCYRVRRVDDEFNGFLACYLSEIIKFYDILTLLLNTFRFIYCELSFWARQSWLSWVFSNLKNILRFFGI